MSLKREAWGCESPIEGCSGAPQAALMRPLVGVRNGSNSGCAAVFVLVGDTSRCAACMRDSIVRLQLVRFALVV